MSAGQVGAEPAVIAADDGTTGWLAAVAPGTDVMPISAQINLLSGGGGSGHAGEPLQLSLFGDAAITRLSDQAIDSNGTRPDTVPATFEQLRLSGYVEVGGTEGAPGDLTGPVTVTLLAPAQGRFGPPSTGESTAGIEGVVQPVDADRPDGAGPWASSPATPRRSRSAAASCSCRTSAPTSPARAAARRSSSPTPPATSTGSSRRT